MLGKERAARRSTEQWRAIVDQQIQSGLSGAAFCKAEGIKYQSFMNWRKKLGPESEEINMHSNTTFVELTKAEKPSISHPQWHIELDLAPGVQLRIAR